MTKAFDTVSHGKLLPSYIKRYILIYIVFYPVELQTPSTVIKTLLPRAGIRVPTDNGIELGYAQLAT